MSVFGIDYGIRCMQCESIFYKEVLHESGDITYSERECKNCHNRWVLQIPTKDMFALLQRLEEKLRTQEES